MKNNIALILKVNFDWEDYEDVAPQLLLEDSGLLDGIKDGVSVDILPSNEEKVVEIIRQEIERLKNDWERFPPKYCGHVEAEIQQREYDAKIEALSELVDKFLL